MSNRPVDPTNLLGNIERIFSTLNNTLEKDVRDHLKNVYSTLTISLIAAMVGAGANHVLGLYSWSFLLAIAQFALLFVMTTTPSTRENENKRLAYLLGFSFLVGCNTGPLVEIIGAKDPSVVLNAYLITLIVFGSFSLSALYAESTKFLHLGGILTSALFCLLITSFFARSHFMYSVIIWGGLGINCAFILYDTQLIAERKRRGDSDYIWHTVILFLDFVNVFRYILLILKDRKEMLIQAIIWVDKARFWIPTSLLSASMVPFASVSLSLGAFSWIVPRNLWRFLDNKLYSAYMRLTLFVFESVSDVEVYLYGDIDELKSRKESVIVISNHQSNVDWAVINMLAARQSPDGFEYGLRFVVKSAIHFVPLFGWYIFQHGYIYVRRFGAFVPDPLLRQFEYLKNIGEPFWLHIFPEGTRFNKEKPLIIENSKIHAEEKGLKVPEFTLLPRTGAFSLALEELKPVLDGVYDVTIGYGQTRLQDRMGLAPNMFEFVSGSHHGKQVHIHVKRFSVSEIPSEKEDVKKWLNDRFVEKDGLMKDFYSSGSFPEIYEKKSQKVPFLRTAIPFCGFVTLLALPIFSEKARKVYLWTMASSPFLILWLHLRKCV
ncbi:hypothetical protein FO519_007468 [Halicephalobus sp. NKZ332]|nr:hypothetical protein FO519_007468 [Halicephalobus sp. NKZ332]